MRKKDPGSRSGFFFLINIIFFVYSFKYETIEINTHTFFMVIILSIGGVRLKMLQL